MSLKFLVDSMHGYVARWLRIMGYDTVYLNNSVKDNEAVRLASEGRILITSDIELAKRAEAQGVLVVMVKGLSEQEVLRILVERFNLIFREDSLRCTVCNGELKTIGLNEVFSMIGFVPRGVEKFWKCKSCGKVYWKGSHWRNISRQISRLVANGQADTTV
ncbi:MAG: Mut7-C RNAse domain-containing protein [Thermoproteota archaeon]